VNALLERLFGLDTLAPGQEGVRFETTLQLPAWAWAPIVVGVVGLALLSYWRLAGRTWARATLAGVRAAALVVLLLAATGPRLIRDNERIERDALAVLVDRSASMTMPDAGSERGATRDEHLRAVLAHPVWAGLAEQHEMVYLGFDASAYEVDPASLEAPDGPRTRLGAGVRAALDRLGGRPVAGVVLLTDGRTSDPPDTRLMRELTAARVGLFPVPFGSDDPLFDLAVEGVDAPGSAFIGDFVPVTARLTARGAADASPATVTLLDADTGLELDTLRVEADQWTAGRAEVRLTWRPEEAGRGRWLVRVVPDGPDLLEANNERSVEIELVDRPLRVVYFDGYPRWEYRYVKDLLVRERSIRSSVMLLATDRRYIQEGDVGLPHVPRSSGEWGEFDVIVLGDVRPDVFSPEQLEQIREQVARRGAGLVWIAGPGANPWRWASTPLADLLPFATTGPSGARTFAAADWAALLSREPDARRLGVLEMGQGAEAGWLEALSDPGLNWPVLRWALAIQPEAVKATADVLATIRPAAGGPPEGFPAVLTMRYGAGRVVFVGTDEIWRWRYARGEALPERFYLPLMRLAGRGSLGRGGRPALLDAQPRLVGEGEPVRIEAVLLDQSLVDAAPPEFRVRVSAEGPGARVSEIKLGPDGPAAYAAGWVAPGPGAYTVVAAEPILSGVEAQASFRVVAPDDELRVPEADHGLLAELAERTGGVLVEPESLEALAEAVPNRSVVVVGEPEVETLWDKPIVLAVLVVLFSVEWIGRRLLRLA
jgi:hypothetical protein